MGYLSFQGGGASSGRGSAAPWCVNTWGIDGGLSNQHPLDLTSFQKALGIPLQLYAPYFCPDSPSQHSMLTERANMIIIFAFSLSCGLMMLLVWTSI